MKSFLKRIAAALLGAAVVTAVFVLAMPIAAARMGDVLWCVPMVGMLVNMESISAVFVNLKTTFQKAFDAAPSQWQLTAMEVPSTGLSNDYNWIDLFPKFRKWIGEKFIKSLKAHFFSIVNQEWETTISVKKRHLETDQLGIYEMSARSAGHSAKTLPDEIISTAKNEAFASLCFDGQYFYDSDHPVTDADGVSASVSNVSAEPLSVTTLALAAAGYGAGRIAIMSFKDDEGRPLGLVPDTLEVPPALESVARTLLESDRLDDDKPNPYRGTAKLIVNPRLTSTTAWFLHVTSMPIKPYVYQVRKAPVLVEQTGADSDGVFKRGEFLFGAEADCAGGYTLWQLSYGSTGA
jgi:phage major head subunit gpT-like protein